MFITNRDVYACPIYYGNNKIWWFTCPQVTENLIEGDTLEIRQEEDVVFNIRKNNFCEGLCCSFQECWDREETVSKPLFPTVKELIDFYDKEYLKYKVQGINEISLIKKETGYQIISIHDGLVIKIKFTDVRLKFNGTLVYHLGAPYGVLFNPTESTEEEIWPSILQPLKTLISKNDSTWGKDEYIIIPLNYLITLVSNIEDSLRKSALSVEDVRSRPISHFITIEVREEIYLSNLIQEIDNTIHKSDSFISIKKLNEQETASLQTDLPDWAGANQFFIQQEIIKKFTKMIEENNLIIIRGPAGIGKSWFINYWKRYIHKGRYKNYVIDSNEILEEIQTGIIAPDMDYNDLISIWLLHILTKIGRGYPAFANIKSVKEHLNENKRNKGWTFLISFMQTVYDITREQEQNDQASILVIIHLDDLQKYLKDKLAESMVDNITASILKMRSHQWGNDKIKLILTTREFPFLQARDEVDFKLNTFSKEQVIRIVFSIFESSESHNLGDIIHKWTGGSSIYLNMFFNELYKIENELTEKNIDEIAMNVKLWQSANFRLFSEICAMLVKEGRFNLYNRIYNMLKDNKICNVHILRDEGNDTSKILDLTESFLFQEDDVGNLTFANQIVEELYSPQIMRTYLYGIESN